MVSPSSNHRCSKTRTKRPRPAIQLDVFNVLVAVLVTIMAIITMAPSLVHGGPEIKLGAKSEITFAASISDTAKSLVQINLSTTLQSGWVGVCLGGAMSDADCWLLAHVNGKWKFGAYKSAGQEPPKPDDKPQQIASVKLAGPSVTFTRPVAGLPQPVLQFKNADQEFIYGVYTGTDATSPPTQLHTDKAQFKYNVFAETLSEAATAATAAPGWISTEKAYEIHGAIMNACWVFMSFMAIFVARFMKNALGVYWFRIHVGIFVFVLLGTFFAGGLAYWAKGANASHFTTTHGVLGIIIVSSTLAQVVLGFVINKLWNADRTKTPVIDKIHWALGGLLAILGPVNVFLADVRSKSWNLVIINGIVIGIFVICFIVGQLHFGHTKH